MTGGTEESGFPEDDAIDLGLLPPPDWAPVEPAGPDTDPRLLDLLKTAGDEWGPLGVALAAAQLTDVAVLRRLLQARPAFPQDALALPVDQMGLSVRSRNALLREGYRTAGQLVSVTAGDLMDIRYFGTAMLAEVRQVLRRAGLALAGDES